MSETAPRESEFPLPDLERSVVEMLAFGYRKPDEIARRLGQKPADVKKILAKLRKNADDRNLIDFEELRRNEVARIEFVVREAKEQWERSKENAIKTNFKVISGTMGSSGGNRDGKEMTKIEEGQTGDPRYLQIILDGRKQLAEVFGTDAPKRIHITEEHERQIVSRLMPVFQKYLIRLGATQSILGELGADVRLVMGGFEQPQQVAGKIIDPRKQIEAVDDSEPT
jgi:DNA-binding MarR family transcriptional regulator